MNTNKHSTEKKNMKEMNTKEHSTEKVNAKEHNVHNMNLKEHSTRKINTKEHSAEKMNTRKTVHVTDVPTLQYRVTKPSSRATPSTCSLLMTLSCMSSITAR